MRTIYKQWTYNNGCYELRVEITQKSMIGFKSNGMPIGKYIITPQVFYGISKQECLNKLQTYKYNDSHGFTIGIDKSIMKLL
jgi:hypothetical protein